MLQTNGVVTTEEFPVSAEHSYSLGGTTSRTNSTFGSDGDSMPESPLSLDDGMFRNFLAYLTVFGSILVVLTGFCYIPKLRPNSTGWNTQIYNLFRKMLLFLCIREIRL